MSWESLFGDAVSIVTTVVTLILLIDIVLARWRSSTLGGQGGGVSRLVSPLL